MEYTFTKNGAKTPASTKDPIVDLFAMIGVKQNDNDMVAKKFEAAFLHDQKAALRVLLWARDCRGGAGRRDNFHTVLNWLFKHRPVVARRLVEEGCLETFGRYSDYIPVLTSSDILSYVKEAFAATLKKRLTSDHPDAPLIAKWLPRKGKEARIIRDLMGMTPKQYRKTLVTKTSVVESLMCANQWDDIDFTKVPSKALSYHSSTFARRASKSFSEFKAAIREGRTNVKTTSLYPHNCVMNAMNGDEEMANLQWEAIPNFLNTTKTVLPIIDVSGSMKVPINNGKLEALHIAIGLGMYVAERNEGPFKDMAMTFHQNPTLYRFIDGSFSERLRHINCTEWGGNTDFQAVFERILDMAVKYDLTDDQLPDTVLVVSDMEFDKAGGVEETNFQAIDRKFKEAGYRRPKIVFWNVVGSTYPVTVDDNGTCVISGYSTDILKHLFDDDLNPSSLVNKVINVPRYEIKGLTK